MSLFKARDWWSTTAGDNEEYDTGCLCVANIDNSPDNVDKVIVGSYFGILRIYSPQPPKYHPEDLMLEYQLQQPILQLEAGKFVSESDALYLAILHPRKLSIYSITAITGSVEHGSQYAVKLAYEHLLERTSCNFVVGSFGGVKGKDFFCVQSMDGMVSFFEQESFAFGRFLPGFLLPGPLKYIPKSDSFVTCSTSRSVECYKYQSLAQASEGRESTKLSDKVSGKRLTSDWSVNIGECAKEIYMVSFQNAPSSIFVLGERSIFCLRENGNVRFMKKLEYDPSTFYPYGSTPDGGILYMIATHTDTLLVYKDITLCWAAQMPSMPVALRAAELKDLKGLIISLDQNGRIQASYLGTDPSMFIAPPTESREINYEELDKEMKELQKLIKESSVSSSKFVLKNLFQNEESITMQVHIPPQLDQTSIIDGNKKDEDVPSLTIKVSFKSSSTFNNVVVTAHTEKPLTVNQHTRKISLESYTRPMGITYYVDNSDSMLPINLTTWISGSYVTSQGAPKTVQQQVNLPMKMYCKPCQPVKVATHKITIDTNRNPVNLYDIFPEYGESKGPGNAIGFQYYNGPKVTLLASKTSQRYRLQSDNFEALALVTRQFVERMKANFANDKNPDKFKVSFTGSLPLHEFFELIDAHFNIRLEQEELHEKVQQEAEQYRAIQRRLLTRFKDKTPSPLLNLDVILDSTHATIMELADKIKKTEEALSRAANALSCGTSLLLLLLRLNMNLNDSEFRILEATLSPIVIDLRDQGWEELTDAAITHLLRTCLAKSAKDQAVNLPPLKIPSDTQKLKKHIAMMCDRLTKGGKLAFESNDVTTNGLPEVVVSDPKQILDDYPSKETFKAGIILA
ncbi:uncharacterized protein TRIADDRAFT_22294 [Trichoplax adhaerens]|uniref:Protein PTHB1 n=1 Tax=Trichoplax adhaerens TaxID=10228 RepID=B3RRG2_TRIAD|nr:hypothetical protein TRIADDRAFT_22294 [Trichoplax adhaerens]EDV26341.1 hypothetical protein TRIADDRAFT_22294 [Trichoplax adhaerens]|eukprot:XP_002110337.1 hypothetical protein TRIADDRAFT_22294 [Trichoplax adhaerens]